MAKVQSTLKSAKGLLQQKEKEHLDKYKNNVPLLNKYSEEKTKLHYNLKNYMNKVKHLEEKLQHVPIASSQELEASRQGKRDSTHFSSSQEEGLRKPPKQQRALKEHYIYVVYVNTFEVIFVCVCVYLFRMYIFLM